jgi:hypothetical protein
MLTIKPKKKMPTAMIIKTNDFLSRGLAGR